MPMYGFRDRLPSVRALIELLQRERLRGLSVLDKEIASAFWGGGMDYERVHMRKPRPGISF